MARTGTIFIRGVFSAKNRVYSESVQYLSGKDSSASYTAIISGEEIIS
jgi:hypothetical protein